MTLYAPDGLQMIMMERFQGYTTAVDCNDDDDGIMSLTFASQSAYDYALRTWSSINEKEQDKFLLIANHPGCSPVDQRQPYLLVVLVHLPDYFTLTLLKHYRSQRRQRAPHDIFVGQACQLV